MDTKFHEELVAADTVVHPVEKQWHYKIMRKYGFVPLELEAVGFVRSYTYEREGHMVRVHTGVNSDYWLDLTKPACGFWIELEPHMKKITNRL